MSSISSDRSLRDIQQTSSRPVVLIQPAPRTVAVSLTPNRGARGEKGDASVIENIDLGEFT